MSGRWRDLRVRVASAAVLAGVGGGAVWAGGLWFALLVAVCAGCMIWELARMVGGSVRVSLALAVLGALCGTAPAFMPAGAGAGVIAGAGGSYLLTVLPALAGAGLLRAGRSPFAAYALAIMGACVMLLMLRGTGLRPVLILLAVVVATDVAGYFAGRLIGGPKIWPRLSPGKTWAGSVAGWGAAAIVMLVAGGGPVAVALGVFLSFAAQAGDAAESALKRAAGVGDASSLIPGHGGFLDRFDGLVGAALAVLLLQASGFNIWTG